MGRKTLLLITDISVVADLRATVEKTHEAFDRIDIRINNAGWNALACAAAKGGPPPFARAVAGVGEAGRHCECRVRIVILERRGYQGVGDERSTIP